MGCFNPNFAVVIPPDEELSNLGFKSQVIFNRFARDRFRAGEPVGDVLSRDGEVGEFTRMPCGQCSGCKLDRSREWAIRCVHEAQMHEYSSFITFTIGNFPQYSYSLDKALMQRFHKKLRISLKRGIEYFDSEGNKCVYKVDRISFYYCGEYGDKRERPHYHGIYFGIDFPDKYYWKTHNGYNYYRSPMLEFLWPYGNSVIGDVSFESAAYVARYTLKKDLSDPLIYGDRLPEYSQASLKPAIGKRWFDRYGMTDVFPLDECIAPNGVHTRVPRYYLKLLERRDPKLFVQVKEKRRDAFRKIECDVLWKDLKQREYVKSLSLKKLIRNLEIRKE